jgi:predicted GNAT family acetyltransferase
VIGSAQVGILGPQDEPLVRDFLAEHPVDGCLIAARVHALGMTGAAGQTGELCAYHGDTGLQAVWLDGPSLVLVGAQDESGRVVEALVHRLAGRPRRCSSIVGPDHLVLPLWSELSSRWGPARDVRPNQPLLALDCAPLIEPSPHVRRVRRDQLDILMPAATAMFREEVGVDPEAGDRGASYRARVAELIDAGHSLAWIDKGEVLFKAELGAVSEQACQVQGIWVRPDLRGQGIGTSATAAVAAIALADVAPVVSLYVNDFNAAAKAAYARVGFTQVGTFASVLF